MRKKNTINVILKTDCFMLQVVFEFIARGFLNLGSTAYARFDVRSLLNQRGSQSLKTDLPKFRGIEKFGKFGFEQNAFFCIRLYCEGNHENGSRMLLSSLSLGNEIE